MGLRASKRRERYAEAGPAGTGLLRLCIDTSGSRLNVALARGDELLAVHSALHPFSHAAALLPVIDLLLEGQRLTVGDVQGLGICVGPGSFTGLRVGMTTARAIAAARNLPVAAVPSTLLLAAGSGAGGLVAPLIDARRGEVYSSLYRVDGSSEFPPSRDLDPGQRIGARCEARPSRPNEAWPEPRRSEAVTEQRCRWPEAVAQGEPVEVLAPEAGTPEGALGRILEASLGSVTLVGSACQTYDAVFREKGGDRVAFASRSRFSISPETLSEVCRRRLDAGLTADVRQLEPLYVGRPPIHGK